VHRASPFAESKHSPVAPRRPTAALRVHLKQGTARAAPGTISAFFLYARPPGTAGGRCEACCAPGAGGAGRGAGGAGREAGAGRVARRDCWIGGWVGVGSEAGIGSWNAGALGPAGAWTGARLTD
jgi:hypothetical protein